jgi:hypothetical protein
MCTFQQLYLGVLPANQSEWLTALRSWRTRYMDLRQKVRIGFQLNTRYDYSIYM